MPSVSRAQQRYFGMLYGKLQAHDLSGLSEKDLRVLRGMGYMVKEYAQTKHQGIPEKIAGYTPSRDIASIYKEAGIPLIGAAMKALPKITGALGKASMKTLGPEITGGIKAVAPKALRASPYAMVGASTLGAGNKIAPFKPLSLSTMSPTLPPPTKMAEAMEYGYISEKRASINEPDGIIGKLAGKSVYIVGGKEMQGGVADKLIGGPIRFIKNTAKKWSSPSKSQAAAGGDLYAAAKGVGASADDIAAKAGDVVKETTQAVAKETTQAAAKENKRHWGSNLGWGAGGAIAGIGGTYGVMKSLPKKPHTEGAAINDDLINYAIMQGMEEEMGKTSSVLSPAKAGKLLGKLKQQAAVLRSKAVSNPAKNIIKANKKVPPVQVKSGPKYMGMVDDIPGVPNGKKIPGPALSTAPSNKPVVPVTEPIRPVAPVPPVQVKSGPKYMGMVDDIPGVPNSQKIPGPALSAAPSNKPVVPVAEPIRPVAPEAAPAASAAPKVEAGQAHVPESAEPLASKTMPTGGTPAGVAPDKKVFHPWKTRLRWLSGGLMVGGLGASTLNQGKGTPPNQQYYA